MWHWKVIRTRQEILPLNDASASAMGVSSISKDRDNMATFGHLSSGLSLLLSSGMTLSKSGMQFSVITVDFFHWANQFFMLQYCSFCTQLNRVHVTLFFFFSSWHILLQKSKSSILDLVISYSSVNFCLNPCCLV